MPLMGGPQRRINGSTVLFKCITIKSHTHNEGHNMHSLIRDHLKTSAALTATDARIATRLRGTLIRSPAEALLLSVLADDRLGAAYGLQELSARAAVCSPNASRMVAHAVACGLMLREACPGDGRAVTITITDKGVRELMKAGLVYA